MVQLTFAKFSLLGLAAASPGWKRYPGHQPSWPSITHIISFGDSYTQTEFDPTGEQPSSANPLGNPPYPGYTSSNGPNWIDFLTTTWNRSFIETVNLAYSGATVDGAVIPPYTPTVVSIKQQISNEYIPIYSKHPSSFNWQPKSTLFAIFIGINDVNLGYKLANKSEAYPKAIAEYAGLMDELYYTGARNFLFLNVPPIDRSPGLVAAGPAAVESQKIDVAAWNKNVSRIAQDLNARYRDANAMVFDTNKLYNEVIDHPCSEPETCAYKDTTDYCANYASGTPSWYTKDPNCTYAVDEYFWLNTLHPTFRVHNATAKVITKQFESGHSWW